MKYVKLNISILPIIVILLVAGVGLYVLNSKSGFLNFGRNPEIRRLNGFPTVLVTDKQLEKKRLVIKNQDELNTFLNEIDESGYLTLKENIDFEKEYLLGASSKTFSESMHELRVKKLYIDKENASLLVSLKEVEPGDSCEVEVKNEVAVDLVAISKTDMPIEFERIREVKECD